MMRPSRTLSGIGLLLFTAAALLIHGYHFGAEDQAIYVPAIKRFLDPSYPASVFFLATTSWTLFPQLVASCTRLMHFPLDVTLFIGHLASIFLLLLGSLRLSERLFSRPVAHWSSVAMLTGLLTLPVTGTGLFPIEPYFHPRDLAVALFMFALLATLDRRPLAIVWIALAACVHIQITMYAAVHLLFQAPRPTRNRIGTVVPLMLLLIRAWAPANDAWRQVLRTRDDFLIFGWSWYEWLGVFGPLLILQMFAHFARRRDMADLATVSGRLAMSGTVMVAAAILVNALPLLERCIPLQPMRSLLFIYLLLAVFAGGWLGQVVLQDRRWRWAALFLPLYAGMFYTQRREFPASPHIEWPGRLPANDWVSAFDWVRFNTPRNALFALDPMYLERPGNDFHGFRAFADRRMLADYVKDRGIAAQFPELADQWQREVHALQNWGTFGPRDYRGLRENLGVTWVIVEQPGRAGLSCPYANHLVMVCSIE
jgi:hypothetical protein